MANNNTTAIDADTFDKHYNTIAEELSDWDDSADEPYGYGGKRIPYIGWFWRWCEFSKKHVAIGDSGSFIGVMQSNKWGYDERGMTPDEVDAFVAFLDRANGAKDADLDTVLREMWDWFQTLTIEQA